MVATATLLTRSIQGESLSAATDRLINLAMKQGVIDFVDNSFEVLEDTGSNMVITIGSGNASDRAVIEGDLAGQGLFVAEHQNATQTLSVAASDPTNDRIDRVIIRTYDDTFDSSGDDFSDLEVITGTPDASPSAPAEPQSSYTIATILVQSTVTAITDSDITDLRFEAPVRGQFVERIIYTGSGSFVKADFPWLDKVIVKVQAGGGGGSSSDGTDEGGAGGGGGGYAEQIVDVGDLSASETVTVGTGGAGAAAGDLPGVAGLTSSFGAHAIATGGSFGGGATGAGGVGGLGSTGDLPIEGEGGSGGRTGSNGTGGSSHLGGGARGLGSSNSTTNGTNGGDFGGGGSGSWRRSSGTPTGGDGADGVIIVDLYA